MAEEWNEETCIQLIREYRARPVLWDQQNPYFFKKEMKPQAWESIGRALKIHADTCKHKMVVLMSSFRREKSKIMNSIKDGDASTAYRSTWFGFKEMAFLMDKDSERKRIRNGTKDPQDVNDATTSTSKPSNTSFNPPNKRMKTVHDSITKEVVKMYTQSEDNILAQITPSLPKPLSETEEEIKSFTNFIAMKMKRYSENTKNSVQQAICEIIFRADQNLSDNDNIVVNSSSSSQPDPLYKSDDVENDIITIIKENYSDSD